MDFMKRMQETLNQGLNTSRDLYGKAKDRAKDLGEKGMLSIEIKQLETQAEKLTAKLGSMVYELLVKENRNTVSKSTAGIKELLIQVEDVEKRIIEREDALKKIDEKTE